MFTSFDFALRIRVLEVFLEREDQKGTKGSEDSQEHLGLQVEPLGSEGLRDPQGLLESQANQEYREFLDEPENSERLGDQEKR